ncbi:YdeI family protein [uncultured Croceitalea sp.]|uniref:YdeI/OmpD-associated family protein n=1 Tax=uncultured Croceitalea sp. TaxID=1798908 RepID=UPI00374E9C34
MDKSEKVEAYYEEEHHYKNAIGILRGLVLKTKLEETYKWMFPTYTLEGKNVLSICKFKGHFCIWFFNGVFLTDSNNVLRNAQDGKTKAMRQWKFTEENQIDKKAILGYISEAIDNQKNGRISYPSKTSKPIAIPELLLTEFKKNKQLKNAYNTLTTYKQKEFNEHIATAKQEKTKLRRLEKIIPMILAGEGLSDKYR